MQCGSQVDEAQCQMTIRGQLPTVRLATCDGSCYPAAGMYLEEAKITCKCLASDDAEEQTACESPMLVTRLLIKV
jgi:hypothetical protein